MRTTFSRHFALAGWFAIGLSLALILAGCGGGSSNSQFATDNASVACADGTVASYVGTSCTQMPAVFQWTSYSCTSTPSSICAALGTNGSNIKMSMDPNGQHTILVGSSQLWNVTAGQSVDVVISGTIYGASTNNNWPHFGNVPGQTGDGTEDNKTTVLCGTDCVALNGVSDIPCNQNSPIAYCIDQNTIDPYLTELAKFHPATSDHPYPFTVEIKLNGGITGTATLQSVGIHL